MDLSCELQVLYRSCCVNCRHCDIDKSIDRVSQIFSSHSLKMVIGQWSLLGPCKVTRLVLCLDFSDQAFSQLTESQTELWAAITDGGRVTRSSLLKATRCQRHPGFEMEQARESRVRFAGNKFVPNQLIVNWKRDQEIKEIQKINIWKNAEYF